jgi:Skp family chaperone for outer membrane proteins
MQIMTQAQKDAFCDILDMVKEIQDREIDRDYALWLKDHALKDVEAAARAVRTWEKLATDWKAYGEAKDAELAGVRSDLENLYDQLQVGKELLESTEVQDLKERLNEMDAHIQDLESEVTTLEDELIAERSMKRISDGSYGAALANTAEEVFARLTMEQKIYILKIATDMIC